MKYQYEHRTHRLPMRVKIDEGKPELDISTLELILNRDGADGFSNPVFHQDLVVTQRTRRLPTELERLEILASREGELAIALSFQPGRGDAPDTWGGMMTVGREAPNSPIAGGASMVDLASSPMDALRQMLHEFNAPEGWTGEVDQHG